MWFAFLPPGFVPSATSSVASEIIYGISCEITPFRTPEFFAQVAAGLRFQLKKTVVLVGMMGSGKTAVGTALARLLEVPFLDSDAEIERAASMTIAEIFERDGEAFFREKETQVLGRLLEGAPGILSTGGGAYLKAENRAMISDKGVAVWLRASVDLLWSRVKHKDTRPLLRTPDPYATLKSLCATREPSYEQADLVVDASKNYTVEDMARQVIEALLARPDVLVRIA
ncbi:MAG: shikimate kinase [Rhodobacteraceae bacterium]|nr:shikimate kinase [Paracoccaceae bacterium]